MAQWQKTTSVADIKAEEYLQKLAKKKEVLTVYVYIKKNEMFLPISTLPGFDRSILFLSGSSGEVDGTWQTE